MYARPFSNGLNVWNGFGFVAVMLGGGPSQCGIDCWSVNLSGLPGRYIGHAAALIGGMGRLRVWLRRLVWLLLRLILKQRSPTPLFQMLP
jgi:hypothetical protein